MLFLAVSLFFTNPAPFDMPRQEAYLVREKGVYRLEDRCRKVDLWFTQTMTGRWYDDSGRVFSLAKLSYAPPAVDLGSVLLRRQYEMQRHAPEKKDLKKLRDAVEMLSPVEIAAEPFSPRQNIRGYREILYWHGTNETALAAAYLREGSEIWDFAVWEFAQGDDHALMKEIFEKDFLAKEAKAFYAKESSGSAKGVAKKGAIASERELLRRDAAHSVAAYRDWHVCDSKEFTLLHALAEKSPFISALTNELTEMRALYASTIPSPIDGTNVLAVARIFATREDFIEVVGTNMAWAAAYWSPERRELVAYMPDGGDKDLLETFRHEAFHQYLSYASSMIAASPWFNEGYAQYFEGAECEWRIGEKVTPDLIDAFAEMLPSILLMDYETFYSGTAKERRLKYRLAWSIAHFIEKGAPFVRFNPFKNLKRDYMQTLLDRRDMHEATAAVFKNPDFTALFVDEWRKFWREASAQ